MALRACTGWEFGTTAGWATGNAGNRIFDTVQGTPTIASTNPRTGAYCLEVSAAAGIENVQWTTDTLGTGQTWGHIGFAVRFPGSLPAASCMIAEWVSSGWNGELWFDQATGNIAAQMQGGTRQQGPALAADTWYWVELRYDNSTSTTVMEWWVDGTAQTSASRTGGTSGGITAFVFGSQTSQTMTCRYDDAIISTATASITAPIGPHKVVLLKPDIGGALDVSTIITTEWNTFAGATPTLSAWDATTALGAIDEVPVGLGASADGFCRITGTDADYVGVPMTSYNVGGETIAGLRMLACCWAATATACTHSFASYNGATATTLLAAADVGTDNSATAPAWVCKMATLADFDTQGELDALQFRFGSTDTSPDAGIHAIYAEVAIKQGTPPAFVPQGGRARARRLIRISRGGVYEPPWPQAEPPEPPAFVPQPRRPRLGLLTPSRGRTSEPPWTADGTPPQRPRRPRPLPRQRHGWTTPPPVPTAAPEPPAYVPQGGRAMARRVLRIHRGCACEPPWPQAPAAAPAFVASPVRRTLRPLARRRVRPVPIPVEQPWVAQPQRHGHRLLPYRHGRVIQPPTAAPVAAPVFVAEPRRHRARLMCPVRRRLAGFVPAGLAPSAPGVHTALDMLSVVVAAEVPVAATAGELASAATAGSGGTSILVAGELATDLTATGGPP